MTPRATLTKITPAKANRLLERNHSNRKVRQMRVNQYAADMKAGDWGIAESAIAIAQDGTLLNGQHRLWAVVESGVTIDSLLIEGMPKESRAHMDSGAVRTAADFFTFNGEKNTTTLAATLRLITRIDDGRWAGTTMRHRVSNSQMARTIAANPDIRESVNFAMPISQKTDLTGTQIAVVHHLISRVNGPDLANRFFEQIASPVGEYAGSPVLAVNSRLARAYRAAERLNTETVISFLIRAWNKWSAHEEAYTLPLTTKKDSTALPTVARWSRDSI